MDSELTPEQKFNAESPDRMVPRALLEGRNPDDIVADLVRLDWSPEKAWALIKRVARDILRYHESPESRAALVKECRIQMVSGFLLALLGLFASGLSLLTAISGRAGLSVVFVGAILGGLVIGSRGLARWRLYRGPYTGTVVGELIRMQESPGILVVQAETSIESITRLVLGRVICVAAILCVWRVPDWAVIVLYVLGTLVVLLPKAAVKYRVPWPHRSLLFVPAIVVFVTYDWPKPANSFIIPAMYYGSLAFVTVQIIFDIWRIRATRKCLREYGQSS